MRELLFTGIAGAAPHRSCLARALEKDGIPVLLTVQVDSVAKLGKNDTTIPANVAQAANFYQPHGLVHGDMTSAQPIQRARRSSGISVLTTRKPAEMFGVSLVGPLSS